MDSVLDDAHLVACSTSCIISSSPSSPSHLLSCLMPPAPLSFSIPHNNFILSLNTRTLCYHGTLFYSTTFLLMSLRTTVFFIISFALPAHPWLLVFLCMPPYLHCFVYIHEIYYRGHHMTFSIDHHLTSLSYPQVCKTDLPLHSSRTV
ncbi:hypothetical protein B0F90DRAFT_442511 [Multifurca ochricompacta]|uniref:Uncharacterized protein n=1 Tax=Multifurca ochricompacta TaxID=376703 RepID=A0AAD4LUN5_9AGAM|nr:hypothetical protein B0F90DRAFT_442511 [Multifurca ochricompacta]